MSGMTRQPSAQLSCSEPLGWGRFWPLPGPAHPCPRPKEHLVAHLRSALWEAAFQLPHLQPAASSSQLLTCSLRHTFKDTTLTVPSPG